MIRIVNVEGEPLKTCLSTSVSVPQLLGVADQYLEGSAGSNPFKA